jgi:probable rRNA maturation factor
MNVEVEVSVQADFWQHPSASEAQTRLRLSYPTPPVSAVMWQQWLRGWLQELATDLPDAPCYELTLRLTSDPEIRQLNAQYRHQDKPTDVLAFAALEANLPYAAAFFQSQPLELGDIVISVETAARQAQQQGHSLTTELAWLAAHGCLHLLGWDHRDQDSFQRMINKQVTLLSAINLEINQYPIFTLTNESEIL